VDIWKEAAAAYFVRLRQTMNRVINDKSIEIRAQYLQTVSEKQLRYTILLRYLANQKPIGRYQYSPCQRTAMLSKDTINYEEQNKHRQS
jgi:hypothetical protein